MGMLDGLLGQLGQHVDVNTLAQKLGISADQVQSAVAALAQAHAQPGDTAAQAAAATGLSAETVQAIIGHIGGEGSLARYAQMLGEQEGVLGQIGDFASGFFKKD